VPEKYPFTPPKIKFVTKVYHPNIGNNGTICCLQNFLQSWSPAFTIHQLLQMSREVLNNPSAEDALVYDIAEEFANDNAAFSHTAKQWVQKFAQ
jgi:ubiquitin-protein ligase